MQQFSSVEELSEWVESEKGILVGETFPLAGYVGDLLSTGDALRGAEIASILQIEALWNRRVDTCSSGEEQLVRVAYCLSQEPDALGIVEPYAHLDALRREHLELLLRRVERLQLTRVAVSDATWSGTPALSLRTWERTLAPRLQLTNVSYRHPLAATYALRNVTFSHTSPGLVAVVGANGSGKSTLLHIAHRSVRPLSGKVRRTETYYVPANEAYGPYRGELNRRHLQLQAAFESNAPVLLFDEPSARLSDPQRELLLEALVEQAKTALLVCATHDEALIARADHVICLMNGEIVFSGTAERFKTRSLRWSR